MNAAERQRDVAHLDQIRGFLPQIDHRGEVLFCHGSPFDRDEYLFLLSQLRGAVAVHCAVDLARQVAALMFNMSPENTSIEEVQDALGELVNMTGGNLKALLAEPCYLSLPAVVEGHNYTLRIPGSALVSQVAFECQGHPFLVTLLEKEEKPTKAG